MSDNKGIPSAAASSSDGKSSQTTKTALKESKTKIDPSAGSGMYLAIHRGSPSLFIPANSPRTLEVKIPDLTAEEKKQAAVLVESIYSENHENMHVTLESNC